MYIGVLWTIITYLYDCMCYVFILSKSSTCLLTRRCNIKLLLFRLQLILHVPIPTFVSGDTLSLSSIFFFSFIIPRQDLRPPPLFLYTHIYIYIYSKPVQHNKHNIAEPVLFVSAHRIPLARQPL